MATEARTERVRTDPRISRRRRAVERGRRRRVIASLIAGTVAAAAVWVAFWSPVLDVRHVKVLGARHTGAAEVRRAADLGNGPNLLLVSTGEVAASVTSLPWVKDAEVHRMLPGIVRVKVAERRAALVVTVAAGTWTIDGFGHVLEEGPASKGLPTLTGSVLPAPEPGDRLDAPEVRAGLAVWRSLPKKVKTEVASVVAPSRQRIALVLHDGTLIRYGGPDHRSAKNEVLMALFRRLETGGRSAAYIDISVPTSPAVGPPPATASASPAPTP